MSDHIPNESEPMSERMSLRRKGTYLLPNLFTTGVLFLGFAAIVSAMDGRFEHAALLVFIAMVLDFFDGAVARLTHTQTDFGANYDSLADMVAFGAAPSIMMYAWALQPLGRWGWLFAFVYCGCVAYRLARFNVNSGVVDKRMFQGLPSPSGAALVAGLIWVWDDFGIERAELQRATAAAITVFAGATMASKIPFYSLKTINFRRIVPFWVVLLLFVVLIVISSQPPVTLFLIFLAYSMSGYAMWLWNFRKRRSSMF